MWWKGLSPVGKSTLGTSSQKPNHTKCIPRRIKFLQTKKDEVQIKQKKKRMKSRTTGMSRKAKRLRDPLGCMAHEMGATNTKQQLVTRRAERINVPQPISLTPSRKVYYTGETSCHHTRKGGGVEQSGLKPRRPCVGNYHGT